VSPAYWPADAIVPSKANIGFDSGIEHGWFEMSFSLRGIAWTAFAVAVVLMVGSSVLLLRATRTLRAGDALVAHTHEVETILEDLGSKVFQASNSRRAFVITGNESLLADYRSAAQDIPQDIRHLRLLAGDNQARQRELDLVEGDIRQELELMGRSIAAGERGTSSSEQEIEITLRTADLGNRVHQELQRMRQEEDDLLEGRQKASGDNYQHTLKLIAASFVIALMLLLAEMFLLSYEFTRHRRTEYAARQSQEIVDAFFSASTVGFGILDSQLRYTRFNDVLPRMAGLTPNEVVGKSVTELFGEGDLQADTLLREVLRTGRPVLDREVSAALPGSQDVRYWLVNYFPISKDSGAFTQVGIIAVDVTARRNAEDALRKLSGRLLGIQDQERRRIARELHDSLGQYLAGLKIAIEMLDSRASGNEPLLAECSDILDKAITETRTLSHLLHPPLLDEAGFASAASWFVTGFSQRSGIPVALDIPSDLPRLPEAVEIALFRVLQESLTNVHRHSQASSAEIKVDADAEQVSIEIQDHGRGVPRQIMQQIEQEGSKLGVGLAGMRERIHELGGTFEVSSDDKQGTTIRATIPLGTPQEASPAQVSAERAG
jgi:PAS domain S-box-containing protein